MIRINTYLTNCSPYQTKNNFPSRPTYTTYYIVNQSSLSKNYIKPLKPNRCFSFRSQSTWFHLNFKLVFNHKLLYFHLRYLCFDFEFNMDKRRLNIMRTWLEASITVLLTAWFAQHCSIQFYPIHASIVHLVFLYVHVSVSSERVPTPPVVAPKNPSTTGGHSGLRRAAETAHVPRVREETFTGKNTHSLIRECRVICK